MRRLGRYIYNGVTVLSLLICLATVVLWVRAGDGTDILCHHSDRMLFMLLASETGMGYCRIEHYTDNPSTSNPRNRLPWLPGWWHERDHSPNEGGAFYFGETYGGDGFTFGAPYWSICLITALAPGIWVTRRLRRERIIPGHCPNCHYDLRATPDRCPECGIIPAKGGL